MLREAGSMHAKPVYWHAWIFFRAP